MMKALLISSIAIVLVACGATTNKPNIEVIQDMMEQPSLKAQDFHPYDREKSSMILPPDGTWPKDRKPLLYAGKAVEAGRQLKNPYAGSAEVAQLGERNYKNFCMVCHGEGGAGDGPVAAKFVGVKPPSLLTDKIRNYPDGRIYHIVTYGQGVMGAYINQMPDEKTRWAVVNYVRTLQKK